MIFQVKVSVLVSILNLALVFPHSFCRFIFHLDFCCFTGSLALFIPSNRDLMADMGKVDDFIEGRIMVCTTEAAWAIDKNLCLT